MNAVVRLIAKDAWLQRWFLPTLVVFEAASIACLRLQLPAGVPSLTLLLAAGFALIGSFLICYRVAVAEEKDKAMLFIRSLPVSTREIVTAKAAACLLFATLNVIALMAAYEVSRAMALFAQDEPSVQPLWLLTMIACQWVGVTFFVGVALVFDSEWAIWVPFPALFAVLSAVLNYKRVVSPAVEQWFAGATAGTASVLAVCAALSGLLLWLTFVCVQRKRMLV